MPHSGGRKTHDRIFALPAESRGGGRRGGAGRLGAVRAAAQSAHPGVAAVRRVAGRGAAVCRAGRVDPGGAAAPAEPRAGRGRRSRDRSGKDAGRRPGANRPGADAGAPGSGGSCPRRGPAGPGFLGRAALDGWHGRAAGAGGVQPRAAAAAGGAGLQNGGRLLYLRSGAHAVHARHAAPARLPATRPAGARPRRRAAARAHPHPPRRYADQTAVLCAGVPALVEPAGLAGVPPV